MQNVRDSPQTKLDNGLNSPFLLNEHGDPRFFFQVFAKNRLMKNILQYCRNQAIKNGLNEAILLMSINEALLSRQNFVPF